MEFLTLKHWKHFKNEDDTFNGVEFEKLVENLLPILGISDIQGTKITHDGSRDFENRDRTIWAECKIHKSNVSLRVISPTLVMATIDKPNIIYFFSYSQLNNNLIKHLCRFKNTTNIDIKVFADNTLETLIISNPKVTSKFFPDFRYYSVSNKNYYNTYINFSKDPDVEYNNDEPENPKNITLELNSIFSVDVFIQNLSPFENLKGNLSVNISENGELVLREKKVRNEFIKTINIEGSGIYFRRFCFEVIKSNKNRVKLPIFKFVKKRNANFELINKKNNHNDNVIKISAKYAQVSSVFRPELIGKRHTEIERKVSHAIQARSKPIFINIFGKSGTGKSRILRECSKSLFAEHYGVIKYDGEDKNETCFKNFIRKVFAYVYKLPVVNTEINKEDLPSDCHFVYNILYNENFNLNQNIENCVKYLITGLKKQKVALVIDNLQNFDNDSLLFFDSFINKTENIAQKFVLISCFNTDLLFTETKAQEFFNRLKVKYNNDTFFNEELLDFSDEDCVSYIDSCLKPTGEDAKFSVEYPETYRLLKSRILNRPLFIEQTLFYLEQEDAVERLFNRFYIKDIDKLHNLLNENFPKNLFDLINIRWEKTIKKLALFKSDSFSNSINELIKFMCFFNKIDLKYLQEFNKDAITIIDFLTNWGILSIDTKEKVSFYHYQLFLFFKSRNNIYCKRDYLSYIDFLQNNNLESIYFYQHFIFSEKSNNIDASLLKKALNEIHIKFHFEDHLVSFAYSLFNALSVSGDDIEIRAVLMAYQRLGKIIRIFKNLQAGYELLIDAHNGLDRTQFYGIKEYLDFIHEIVNAGIAIGKDSELLTYIELAISNFSDNQDDDVKLAIAKLQNRLCVIYKSLGKNDEAVEEGQKSLYSSIKLSQNSLIIKNYIDIANIYGREYKNKRSILELWKNAVKIYHSNKSMDKTVKSQKFLIQLYEAQMYILTGEIDFGLHLLKDGSRYCEGHSNYFFSVKYLLIEALAQFCYNRSNVEFSELQSLIQKAKDQSIVFKVNRTYWKVLFIEGLICQTMKPDNHNFVAECYLMALEQFQKIITTPNVEEYNLNFLVCLSCFFKDLSISELKKTFLKMAENLKSTSMKSIIYRIHDMDETEFDSYIMNYSPNTFYNNGKFDFPVLG